MFIHDLGSLEECWFSVLSPSLGLSDVTLMISLGLYVFGKNTTEMKWPSCHIISRCRTFTDSAADVNLDWGGVAHGFLHRRKLLFSPLYTLFFGSGPFSLAHCNSHLLQQSMYIYYLAEFFVFVFKKIFWSLVALQCCLSFYCSSTGIDKGDVVYIYTREYYQ